MAWFGELSEEPKAVTRNLSQDSQSSGLDFNLGSPVYEVGLLAILPLLKVLYGVLCGINNCNMIKYRTMWGKCRERCTDTMKHIKSKSIGLVWIISDSIFTKLHRTEDYNSAQIFVYRRNFYSKLMIFSSKIYIYSLLLYASNECFYNLWSSDFSTSVSEKCAERQ